jgi:hypothetical protein
MAGSNWRVDSFPASMPGGAVQGGGEGPTPCGPTVTTAACLSALGRHEEAGTAWRELAEAKGRLLGEAHAGTLEAREKHANTLYKLGRRQEAAAEYGELAVLSASALGADHADTRRVRRWQADILQEIGNPGNRGPALRPTGRGQVRLPPARPPVYPDTITTRFNRLVDRAGCGGYACTTCATPTPRWPWTRT